MVAVKGRKSSNKNPPILSHEFVIQNHADIVSCVAMVFVVGLMVQITSPWAYIFIALHHNVSEPQDPSLPWQPPKFSTGWKDACAVFFYFLITIVMHAVIQEYVLDKISRRLHLSKIKLSKFNESSQLTAFFVLSALWGIDIIIRDDLLANVPLLWESYPGSMSFALKLFFIGQIAYWLHCYPELYFQRVKKEEMSGRIAHATTGLVFTLAAYLLNFQHVGVILMVLHYISEAMLHSARIIHFVNQKEQPTKVAFMLANCVFVVVRIATILLSALVLVYGLGQLDESFSYATGNYNIPAVRYSLLGAIVVFQAYLLYVFGKYQLRRSRESSAPVISKIKPKQQRPKKKDAKKGTLSEDDDLPEVDQATKKNLRSRSSAKAK
ncbi:translocating chain-associated membrane protein 1 [Venturia canescens]|uniref:translocating chain-associated membrane protein 1 n=1 Tax=Venturia canescens TaxID=32260 RepID=UPI001C9D3025|nr:translocating chain-associated membrane protein 1 [Venturia canescens]